MRAIGETRCPRGMPGRLRLDPGRLPGLNTLSAVLRDLQISCRPASTEGITVIILGIILLFVGFVAKIAILWTIGIIILVIGAILLLLGATGRAVGGRKHWY